MSSTEHNSSNLPLQLSVLPHDLLRTLQRAANCLDLDIQGLTADQVVERYTALGCQVTLDFAARLLLELPSSCPGNGDVAIGQLNQSDLPVAGNKDDGACDHLHSVDSQLTLRFYEWQCGHHGTRPQDIPVSSPEQATAILVAMSHCINQPGHFCAWLMNGTHAMSAYVTDDYVRVSPGDAKEFPKWSSLGWHDERPVLIYGTEAQIAELRHPDNAEAVGCIWFFDSLPAWDGKSFLDDNVATTTLTLAELENLIRPNEWHEPGRPYQFSLPPVLKTAESALEDVRAERASIAACSDVQTPVPTSQDATNTPSL